MAKIGSLEPLLASKRITDSPFIKGGYFPIDKLTDLEDMRVATDTRDGTIVHGSLCYCREDGKFYQFNGESWVEAPGATLKMSDIDDELGNELPEGRVYNAELHAALKNRYRVYTEKSVTDGGGVSPFNYMSANATADKLYNPIGYTDFNKMCADSGLTPSAAVEDKHYIKRTVNGVTEYYSRLTSMVKRSYDDNVRTSTPVDSTDAVPYGYFKKYTFDFGNDKVKNYQVVRRGSTGQLYSTPVVINPATDPNAKGGENFSLRTKQNELLAEVTDSSPTKACVNKDFLNTVLSGYAKAEDLQKTVAEGIAEVVADAPAAFDTLKEMSDWISTHSASAAEMNSAIQGKADSTHNHDGVYAASNHTHTEYASSEHNHDGVYAKTSDIPSLDGYAKTEDIPTVPTKVSELENDKNYVTKEDIQSGEVGGGEQGTPRATNYVFEHTDRLNDWLKSNQDKLVKGDAFYITGKEILDGSLFTFPDYIWDGTTLKETIMPFAKLPLPPWLGEENGCIKEALSLIDIGNIPEWLAELTLAFDRGGSFKDYYPFEESVDDIVAGKGYAIKGDIPTHLSQLSEDETHRVVTDTEKATWNAKSNFSGDYNALTNKPTIPTVPTNVSAFNNDANYATKDDIPSDAHINTLIDSALGGIIDGTVKF